MVLSLLFMNSMRTTECMETATSKNKQESSPNLLKQSIEHKGICL